MSDSPRRRAPPAATNARDAATESDVRAAVVPAVDPPTPTPSPTPEADGALLVVARPWADVSVDGVPRGQTPLARTRCAPSPHAVLLTHPDYQPYPRRVTSARARRSASRSISPPTVAAPLRLGVRGGPEHPVGIDGCTPAVVRPLAPLAAPTALSFGAPGVGPSPSPRPSRIRASRWGSGRSTQGISREPWPRSDSWSTACHRKAGHDVAQACLYLGIADLALDQGDAARARFREAPATSPPPPRPRPLLAEVIAAFEDARREREAETRAAAPAAEPEAGKGHTGRRFSWGPPRPRPE